MVPPDIVKLGREQLVSEGVSPSDIDSKLIDLLVEKRYCKYEDISYQLSQEFNIPLISLQDIRVDDEVLKLLPQETLRKYNVFPISSSGGQLELAISDPMDMDSVDDVSHILNMSVDLRLASPEEIRKAIDDHFGVNAYGDMFDGELPAAGSAADTLATGNEAGVSEEEAPIIRYVHKLITEAVKRRASDIHLEPLEKRFRIRYRIDGVLIEVENPPKRLQPSIISRLKLMANISIAEKRVPQDGRIQITFNNKEIDLRVSSLPTVYGESIVMRILDKEGLRLGLPELGFFSDDQAVFERIVGMADGIFLVTGPTGSGKSTTLYSALNFLNHPDRKIITVEDPVEYQMTGINQVQVRREVGMTFAAA
ncbi:MAG: Flp pilus assembly complex ATPase component TadA, partial [Opitutales bacterium]|nr:Flp pilus assembly complex ATPase component TadA [Opitutales bacterium]